MLGGGGVGVCGPGVSGLNLLSLPGIRQLQLLLLKVALLLGVEIHWGVTFIGLQPPPKKGKYFSAPKTPICQGYFGLWKKKDGVESHWVTLAIVWPCTNHTEPHFEHLYNMSFLSYFPHCCKGVI